MFVNDLHSTITRHCDKVPSPSSLPFFTNFNLFVNAKTLNDHIPYFKDVIQYYYCKFSPVSA